MSVNKQPCWQYRKYAFKSSGFTVERVANDHSVGSSCHVITISQPRACIEHNPLENMIKLRIKEYTATTGYAQF